MGIKIVEKKNPTPKLPDDLEISEEMRELFFDMAKENDIVLLEAFERNVIFVGRTRAGKTTAFKMLRDPTDFAPPLSIFRGTILPELHSFTVEKSFDSEEEFVKGFNEALNEEEQSKIEIDGKKSKEEWLINFNVNIFDTPGLFEHVKGGGEKRGNEALKRMILDCLRLEIRKVHSIFFVCSFAAGIDSEDLKSFEEFLHVFKGAEDNISMLVTRCELWTEDRKKEFKEQNLQQMEVLEKMLEKIGGRLMYTGTIEEDDRKKGRLVSVQKKKDYIDTMRNIIYDFIFKSNKPCDLLKLPIVGELFDGIMVRLKEIKAQIEDYNNSPTSEKKLKISNDIEEVIPDAEWIRSENDRKLFKEVMLFEIKQRIEDVSKQQKEILEQEMEEDEISRRTNLIYTDVEFIKGALAFVGNELKKQFNEIESNQKKIENEKLSDKITNANKPKGAKGKRKKEGEEVIEDK